MGNGNRPTPEFRREALRLIAHPLAIRPGTLARPPFRRPEMAFRCVTASRFTVDTIF